MVIVMGKTDSLTSWKKFQSSELPSECVIRSLSITTSNSLVTLIPPNKLFMPLKAQEQNNNNNVSNFYLPELSYIKSPCIF